MFLIKSSIITSPIQSVHGDTAIFLCVFAVCPDNREIGRCGFEIPPPRTYVRKV